MRFKKKCLNCFITLELPLKNLKVQFAEDLYV